MESFGLFHFGFEIFTGLFLSGDFTLAFVTGDLSGNFGLVFGFGRSLLFWRGFYLFHFFVPQFCKQFCLQFGPREKYRVNSNETFLWFGFRTIIYFGRIFSIMTWSRFRIGPGFHSDYHSTTLLI